MSYLFDDLNIKERSTNFSKSEVDRLQTLLYEYKDVLFSKKTDRVRTKQKEKAWMDIEKKFNSLGETPRTVKQLKYKFENMKRNLKKQANNERKKMIKTGDRPLTSPSPSNLDQQETELWTQLATSYDGDDGIYDDDDDDDDDNDNDDDDIITPKIPKTEPNIILEIVEEKDDQQYFTKVDNVTMNKPQHNSELFDTSTSHTPLKRPVSSPLKRLTKRRRVAGNSKWVRAALNEKKLSALAQLNSLELEKIKNSIEQQKELHEQNLKNNKERHKLEIMKLELEIEILKSKLRFYV